LTLRHIPGKSPRRLRPSLPLNFNGIRGQALRPLERSRQSPRCRNLRAVLQVACTTPLMCCNDFSFVRLGDCSGRAPGSA
jgi:hypothetical protein